MKKSLIAAFLLSSSVGFAQITLEHQYTNATVYVTQVSATDWNYYTIDYIGTTLSIYDITHSLLKTITIPSVGGYTMADRSVNNVSTNLFNTDSLYEYGVFYENNTNGTYQYDIYNELGTQLLSVDSILYENSLIPNFHSVLNGYCFNTNAGIKMIINQSSAVFKGNIYSLGGNYLAAVRPVIGNGSDEQLPYPNPSNATIYLTYDLPAGMNQAEMVITNISGQLVKTCDVGSAFDNIVLDTKQYAPGVYFYYIHSGSYISTTSKFIINR
jgi:Secretion system C-terminal sorting domain